MAVVSIFNVTDVTEPPGRRVKFFGAWVPAGAEFRIQDTNLRTRPVQQRLQALVAARIFHVGSLPAWYLAEKAKAKAVVKKAQAHKPRPRVAPTPEPEEKPKKAAKKSPKKASKKTTASKE